MSFATPAMRHRAESTRFVCKKHYLLNFHNTLVALELHHFRKRRQTMSAPPSDAFIGDESLGGNIQTLPQEPSPAALAETSPPRAPFPPR